MQYTPEGTGTKTITATITDSVLYDASDTATIAGTAASGGQLKILTASRSGTTINVTWSGGTGPYTVYRDGNNQPLSAGCSNVNATSCSGTAPPSEDEIYIKDAQGNEVSAKIN